MKKSTARNIYKKKRQELSLKELDARSRSLAKNTLAYFDLKGKTISIFLPITKFREVNTYLLIDDLREMDTILCTPVSNVNEGTLKHIFFDEKSVLKNNGWGIPEPQNGREIQPQEIDVVFVPLLAVDTFGNRVGYGKGFYDRFLASCSADTVFVGLHFFEPEEQIEEVLSTDIPLHFIVTPSEVFKCRARKNYS